MGSVRVALGLGLGVLLGGGAWAAAGRKPATVAVEPGLAAVGALTLRAPEAETGDRSLAEAPATTPPAADPSPPAVAAVAGCPDAPAVEHLSRARWIRHEVVPRETITGIAYRYGVEPSELREWNELPADVDRVRRRTRLRVKTDRVPPPRHEIEYTVQADDTWWRVAVSHGVDSSDLRSYNWPFRGKMQPGRSVVVWVDPVVYGWIRGGPQIVFSEDDGTIRRGAVGIGPPDDGRLLNGVRIPVEKGWRLRFPESAHGTTHAVSEVTRALRSFVATAGYDGELALGAMSRSRGGPIGGHRSHQTGRDLDIRLPRRTDIPQWTAFRPSRVDWGAAWSLVQALAETDAQVIFLDYKAQRRLRRAAQAAGADPETLARLVQYPRGRHARRGLVRHADGHDKHLHVRFGCGPCEVECVSEVDGGGDP